MKRFLSNIGIFCAALLVIAIPLLCGLSFAFEWLAEIKLMLAFLTAAMFVVVVWLLLIAEENGNV